MPKKLSDFVSQHSKDRTARIRAFLRALGPRYVNQLELCRGAGVAYQDLAKYREQFADHVVPTRNKAGDPAYLWAGTVKLAKQMREVSKRG